MLLRRYNFPAHIENLSNAAAAGRINGTNFGMLRLICRLLLVGRLFTSTFMLTSQIPSPIISLRSGITKSVSPVLGILEARVANSLVGPNEISFRVHVPFI